VKDAARQRYGVGGGEGTLHTAVMDCWFLLHSRKICREKSFRFCWYRSLTCFPFHL